MMFYINGQEQDEPCLCQGAARIWR